MHSLVVVLNCLYGEENGKIVSKIFFIFLRYLPWSFILKYFWVLLFLGGKKPFANTLEKSANWKLRQVCRNRNTLLIRKLEEFQLEIM